MDVKEDLLLWFIKFLKGGSVNIPLESNEELARELHKPIIRNF